MTNDFFDKKGNSGLEAELFAAAFDFRCPFLGTKEDRSMIFGYPNPANQEHSPQRIANHRVRNDSYIRCVHLNLIAGLNYKTRMVPPAAN